MKLGLMFVNSGPFSNPALLAHLATTAERCGVESMWTVEHVVIPQDYKSPYPYSSSGKIPGGEDVAIPDPLLPLAFAAAVTKKIKLATGVLILPQRHPLYVAKEVGHARRAVGRARDPRHRQRMARGGVHLARARFPHARRAHRRGDQIAARVVERDCGVIPRQAFQLRPGQVLSEAGAKGRRADPHRRPFAGRRQTRGPLRRRLLPGARGNSQAQGTVRADEV